MQVIVGTVTVISEHREEEGKGEALSPLCNTTAHTLSLRDGKADCGALPVQQLFLFLVFVLTAWDLHIQIEQGSR